MNLVFVDTSALLALINSEDSFHTSATRVLEELSDRHVALFYSNFVRAETYTRLLHTKNPAVARKFLTGEPWPAERVLSVDEERAKEILLEYEDKYFSYVDATSFAIMERFGTREAFSFDRHFAQFGMKAWGL